MLKKTLAEEKVGKDSRWNSSEFSEILSTVLVTHPQPKKNHQRKNQAQTKVLRLEHGRVTFRLF